MSATSKIKRTDAFETLSTKARLRLLKMHYAAGVGHIGGNLSALDCILYLHHVVMCSDDRFVLSKGHAVGALYITLWTLGMLADEDLETFHSDNTFLPGHPSPNQLTGISVATGSLGHGFPISCGISLARKIKHKSGRVFCLCSDGEWQSGSNWEALVFSRHHNLSNLILLIDVNGLQGFGSTQDVASMHDLRRYFESFDMKVVDLDGHSPGAMRVLLDIHTDNRMVFLLNTVKGKGVSFMEGSMDWHYLPLSKELYEEAVKEQQP